MLVCLQIQGFLQFFYPTDCLNDGIILYRYWSGLFWKHNRGRVSILRNKWLPHAIHPAKTSKDSNHSTSPWLCWHWTKNIKKKTLKHIKTYYLSRCLLLWLHHFLEIFEKSSRALCCRGQPKSPQRSPWVLWVSPDGRGLMAIRMGVESKISPCHMYYTITWICWRVKKNTRIFPTDLDCPWGKF